MNRLDLTLRSTIHIQYANALAFDFSFFGSFFFVAVQRQGYIQTSFLLRSKVFCMTRIRGQAPRYPQNANNAGRVPFRERTSPGIGSASIDWSFLNLC